MASLLDQFAIRGATLQPFVLRVFASVRGVDSKRNDGNLNVRDETTADQPDGNLLAFVLPLIAYLFLTGISPKFGADAAPAAATWYLVIVTFEVLLVGGLLFYFRRVYLSHFPMAIDGLAFVVGAIGIVVWVGLCSLGWEASILASMGRSDWLAERVAVNPWEHYENGWRIAFLVLRFAMLVVIVPVAEELFVRGWLARAVESSDWYQVPLAQVGWRGLLAVTVYGVLSHPAEALAAAAWFSMVSWLMVRTGKFWNCVIAHAVTNLLLGLYVIATGQWQYW